MSFPHWRLLLVALMIFLAGCGPTQVTVQPIDSVQADPESPLQATLPPTEVAALPVTPTQPPTPIDQGEPPAMSLPEQAPIPTGLQDLVDNAKADLAKQQGLAAEQIHVLEAAEVVWPDSSLGCPQKGMEYAQMLTTGFRVVLESGGISYEYHAGPNRAVFFCKNPTPPVIGTPGNT